MSNVRPRTKSRQARNLPPYSGLFFGKTDARNEYNRYPDEFIRSYIDINRVTGDVCDGSRVFIFGPKGTGKSSLAQYVVAVAPRQDVVADVKDAASLPIADIPSLQTGQPQGMERTVTAWKFILLCNYLELLQSDQACKLPNLREVVRVTKLLREFGFMGDASGRALISVSKTTVEIPIPQVGPIYRRESQAKLNIFSLLPYLDNWAGSARSTNRHVLFLDGLDSIFLNDARYDESLAALVQAAYSINQSLERQGASGSIVVLIRNDVFSRISLRVPDSQKMRDDLGIELDWRILSGSAGERAPLMRLVDEKASSQIDREVHVLDYFPQRISVGEEGRTIPRLQYLLNMTRHTPRDLLRLFEEIRIVESSGVFSGGQGRSLSPEVVREGVLQYASRYFVNAIKNEFVGFEGRPEMADLGLQALQSLEGQKFTRESFEDRLNEIHGKNGVDVEKLLRMLFFAGAIGNMVGNDSYMRFYHRRDDAQIYTRGKMVIHNALCHAWNTPFQT